MLRKGKIGNPGFDKLRAIARAMGFSPELWFEEAGEIGHAARIEQPPKKRDIAGRLNHLFEVIKNERTGEPYANADVARMSLGDLTEENVGGIRTGTLENPTSRTPPREPHLENLTMSQAVALAEAFGVHPSYFLETGKKPALLGEQEINALGDQKAREILNESLGLSDR
jgi:hypothetical protein